MYCESFKSSTVDLWPAVSWHSRHLWLATPLSPLTPDLCTLCQIVTSEPEWWVRDEENEPQVSSAIWLVDWSPAEHTSLCTVFWCSRLLPWILSHDFVQCLSIFFLLCSFLTWNLYPVVLLLREKPNLLSEKFCSQHVICVYWQFLWEVFLLNYCVI